QQRDLGMAGLALVRGLGRAAQLHRHGLHAIADAEYWQARIEHFLRRARRTPDRGRLRATGQGDALGRERGDLGRVVVPGPDLAVDADLADAAGDQLGVLRAEVEDEDLVAMDVGHWVQLAVDGAPGGRAACPCLNRSGSSAAAW